MFPLFGLITLDLLLVVLSFYYSNCCPTSARYHRLYAAWFFNCNLQMVAQLRLDTTGFMPRGSSISTYKWCPTAARYHRLYAAWFFNFNLQMVPNCGSIPPALCRVVLQFQPTNG